MRDAAAAAAMSDPENNRWFRRRWAEIAVVPTTPASDGIAEGGATPPADDDLILAGQDLLWQWRRERASGEQVR